MKNPYVEECSLGNVRPKASCTDVQPATVAGVGGCKVESLASKGQSAPLEMTLHRIIEPYDPMFYICKTG